MNRYEDFLSFCSIQHVSLTAWQRAVAQDFLNPLNVLVTESRNSRRSGKTFLAIKLAEYDPTIEIWVPTIQMGDFYPSHIRHHVHVMNPYHLPVGIRHRKVIYDEYPSEAEIAPIAAITAKLLVLRESSGMRIIPDYFMDDMSVSSFGDKQKDWDD